VITSPYRGRLSVAEITQLFFGIGASAFGTTVYGGASASFADLLGNHRLLTAVQVYGGLDNASAFAGYRNRTGRIGWGIDASHVPRETRSSETETEAEASEAEDADEVTTTIRERRVFDRVDVVGEYPLTRNLRFEGGAGYTNIRFERIEEDIGRTNDGEIVYRQERTTRPESPINLVRFPIAFVGDYARFGYTGPLRGRRFRFQAEPTVGSIRYLSARADYREYVYLQPFSVAMRALHVGRYFAAGREEVLAPLSLGFPTLVRGYAPWTFSDAEDPVYQSTQGNRIAAAGIEFRAPLFGPSGIGLIESSPVPLTLLAFLDAGAAWFDADLPEPVFDQNPTGRVPLTSIGTAGRVNFGNVILLEIFWAYPFQRTDDRTITGLRFRAGY
jgi:hypothetical protein